MPRNVSIFVLTFILLFPFYRARASGDVEIVFPRKELVFLPGKVHNIPLVISNLSQIPLSLLVKTELPQGLKLVIPVYPFTLNPGNKQNLTLSINVPTQFQAGKYSLNVSVEDKASQQIVFSETLNFTVQEVENLSLEMLQAPTYVMAGENISATLLLKNLGNNRRTITLEPYQCNLSTPLAVTLNPGESTTLEVKAKTSNEATVAYSHGFHVQAFVNEKIRKSVFQDVKVYPVKEADNDLYFRYPVTLSSRFITRGIQGVVKNGYQFEAFGSGFLDVGKKHQLEFRARGPNVADLSFLGLYDEYYLSYANKNVESFIGDKSYSFTPLIETSRYGRGTENTYITNNGSRFGIMYLEPRFYRDIKNEMAAYAEFAIRKENKLGLYYLTKKTNPTLEDANLGSVSATVKSFERMSVDMEYSLGKYRGITDQAYRVYLNFQHRIASVSANIYHAGKNYPGYYTNSTFYNGNIQVNLTQSLSLGVSARQDFSNAALDTLYSTAPLSNMVMATLYYRATRNLNFRAYYLNYDRKDRMTVKMFDYRSESLNGEVSHDIRKFGYQLGGEYGETTNNNSLSGPSQKQTTYRGTLNLRYRPTYQFNFSAFASYSNQNSFIAPNQQNWFLGASASGQPAKNLTVSFHVQNNYAIENYYQNRNLFQFSADYRFLKRHKISANSYYMLFQNKTEDPDFTFTLGYSVDLGIPLKKTQEAGSISGTLTGSDGAPIKGAVLLLNGRSAITNEQGNFGYRNVAPGRYQLTVDRKNLDFTDILTIPLPLTMDVFSARETKINIGMTKASSLKGRIDVKQLEAQLQALKQEMPELGNVVIDLKDSLETIRIISNSEGRFEFPSIRPGNWTLQIYKNNIHPQYNLEKDHFEFSFQPGESKEVLVMLVPKMKKIVFQQNTLVVGTKPEANSKKADKPEPKKPGKVVKPLQTIKEAVQPGEKWVSVQVASLPKQLNPDDPFLLKNPGLTELNMDGRYKYFSGKFEDRKAAIRHLNQIKDKFPGAFVVTLSRQEEKYSELKEPIRPWLMFFKRNKK